MILNTISAVSKVLKHLSPENIGTIIKRVCMNALLVNLLFSHPKTNLIQVLAGRLFIKRWIKEISSLSKIKATEW